ncbi:sensor histidine kinase [Sulfurospirillum arcachonense]|uniref:sensor histidine kinase n=1 Tax=Sulfurospirillum arcachonense TaxID=57666 RepID=UPI00046806D4|nr:HAMP domain-containing sensor histidine kinase [Sulfurospirillum arcachonense]
MDIATIQDNELLEEIGRRFEEKASSIEEMEFLTKKLLDLNEKSKNAQEVKSQFLSLVKNEFNNPISSLLNISSMLSTTNDIKKINTLGNLLKIELLTIDFSLKNIFAASEIEAGEIANDYSKIEIEEVFNEVVAYFDNLIHEKNLTVTLHNNCEKELISDSQKIYLILLNLISNACEYSYKDQEVTVTLECGEKSFKLIVVDSGEGIKEEHCKEIYNRFIHFETGLTRETAGLGLGLSVAKGMCEALGGIIDNEQKNNSTIFIVNIPYVDESELNLSTAFGSNEFMFDNDSDEMVEF